MFNGFLKKVRHYIGNWLITEAQPRNKPIAQALTSSNVNPESIYEEEEKGITEIYSIWDFLEFQLNTQAYYLTKVIGFEEWLTMDEVRRRVFELFGINFENEKSLYPYIKTLVDCGLLESSNIGGKRKWRKKDLIIKLSKKKQKELEAELQVS